MNAKTLIWIGVFAGGAIGSYVPVIFGAGAFSMSSIIGSTIGSLVGIWAGFKISRGI